MATTRTPKSIRMFMTSFFLPHFIKIVNIKKIDWQHFDRMLPGFLSFFFITDKTGEISRDYANSWHFTSMVENWSFFFSCFIFYLFIFFFSFLNYYYPFFFGSHFGYLPDSGRCSNTKRIHWDNWIVKSVSIFMDLIYSNVSNSPPPVR